MKSIKKLKKYGTAVAGTALLVGATLTGAAAQTSGSSGTMLGDYPAPFVDDDGTIQSSIVVGEDAATADVVGAIDIAGSLSQAAYTTTDDGSSGPATTVNGVTEEANIRNGASGELTAFDYEPFMAGQMEDEDGNPHFVTESAMFQANSTVNGTDAQAHLDAGDISYTVQYSPGFMTNDTISMLGNEYEVTSVASDEVTLGSTVTESELGLDETYEHGPYTVKVEDFNQEKGSVLVQVSKDGESLTMEGIGGDRPNSLSVDNGDFEVNAQSIYFGSQDNYITLSSTYTDTVLEDNSEAPVDEDYDVSLGVSNGDTLDNITLSSTVSTANEADEENNVIQHLSEGENLAGPAGYFNFVNVGLTSAQMTDVDFKTEQRVSLTTPKGTSQTVPMDDVIDESEDATSTTGNVNLTALEEGDWVPIQTEEDEGDGTNDVYVVEVDTVDTENGEVVFSHGDYDWTLPYGESSSRGAPGFKLNVNSDGNLTDVAETPVVTTQYGAELTQSTGAPYTGGAYVTLNETAGDSAVMNDHTVDVVYDSDDSFSYADAGEIAIMNVSSMGSEVASFDTDGDTGSTLTNFGSVASLKSATSAQIDYASGVRSAQFGLGEETEGSSGGDGMSMEPTYGDTFPSLGAVDTDESIGQVKENDNVILVGGPAINELTAELATENQTWDANEWRTGGHEGTSILQLTEGFDGEGGNKALVVAGHAAEDTRTAAEFLSNYGDHSEALSGQDQVTISTETGSVVQ